MSHHQLDLKRYLCPLPVIKVQNQVKQLHCGDTLEVFCTDPGVLHDIPAWCRMYGHEVIKTEQDEQQIVMVIAIK